jgi:hypothetical protein
LCSGILDVYTAMLDVYPRCLLGRRKEKKKFWNSQRELGELCRCGPDDTRGCAGRRWTLGTALDQRRLTRTAATLLDGSAYQGHSLKEALG